jgi:hypothetical protein
MASLRRPKLRKLLLTIAGIFLLQSYATFAVAEDIPPAANEYTADAIAENQGAVAYWYAWGFKYAFGHFPAEFAELQDHGLPLRSFNSPHTGDVIDFDDGSLDFDGDMLYSVNGSGVEIQIQTGSGVTVLPGTLSLTNICGETSCCEILICKEEFWNICDDQAAACKILQWMMWKSFETHECRYGYRPVDEQAWIASGFAPIDANWKELAPYMEIELIYGKCELKKAKVTCCATSPSCDPCAKGISCDKGDKCKQKTCSSCKPVCADKCGAKTECNKCGPVKTECNKCEKAKPVCAPKCESKCETKCADRSIDKCNNCKQKTCSSCKPKAKCGTC